MISSVLFSCYEDKAHGATFESPDRSLNLRLFRIFATPGIGVIACGYSAFNSGCPSDHRYLWLDISYQEAFGYASPPLLSPAAGRLKVKNPEMVKRYNARVVLALQHAGLLDALTQVSTMASQQGWNASLETEYNRKQVEKKIRHL